jgi:hypothetical protein
MLRKYNVAMSVNSGQQVLAIEQDDSFLNMNKTSNSFLGYDPGPAISK